MFLRISALAAALAGASQANAAGIELGSIELHVQSLAGGSTRSTDDPPAPDLTPGSVISFTPTKLVMPITALQLSNSAGGKTQTLYQCNATTESACDLDLADQAAVAKTFNNSVDVDPGTYDTITYSTPCEADLVPGAGAANGFHIGVQGTINIDNMTYVTTANGNVLSASAGDLGLAPVPLAGCNAAGAPSYSFKLAAPVAVAAGQTVPVSVFLTTRNIAWAGTDGSYDAPGCVNAGDDFVCVSNLALVPAVGALTAKVEAYAIATANGDGEVQVVVDQKGLAIGAFVERLYSSATSAGMVFDTAVESFTKNPDGTYDIVSSADPGAVGPRCELTGFRRTSHRGTGNNAGAAFAYTATKE